MCDPELAPTATTSAALLPGAADGAACDGYSAPDHSPSRGASGEGQSIRHRPIRLVRVTLLDEAIRRVRRWPIHSHRRLLEVDGKRPGSSFRVRRTPGGLLPPSPQRLAVVSLSSPTPRRGSLNRISEWALAGLVLTRPIFKSRLGYGMTSKSCCISRAEASATR
jgi:hypothetical protein